MKKKSRRRGSSKRALASRSMEVRSSSRMLDLGHGRYMVESQSEPELYYDVAVMDGNWRCSCAYHAHGKGRYCKHILAIQQETETVREVERDTVTISEPPVACTECGSTDCRHKEARDRKRDGGLSHRYVCNNCKKKFTHRPGFLRRHYDSKIITDALEDSCAGKSLRGVVQSLERRDVRPNPTTIWEWNNYYGDLLKKLCDGIAPRTSYVWSADETYIKSRDSKNYMFQVHDDENRFVVHYEFTTAKQGYDTTGLFEQTTAIAQKSPDTITTDALLSYSSGIEKTMGRKNGTIHRKNAGINNIHANNNINERLNGTIKDRVKTVRGFKSKGPPLITLFLAYYNLFRPHISLGGKTPARTLGVVIGGSDKWLTAIQYAALRYP